MKTSTDRILTTHTGSLPRPKALIDLILGRARRSRRRRRVRGRDRQGGRRGRGAAGGLRRRRGLRRRNVEAVLYDLYPPSRHWHRAGPARSGQRPRHHDRPRSPRPSGFRPRPPQLFRHAVSRLRRRVALPRPLGARPRHRASQSRSGQGEADRSVHDRAVARHPDALHHQPALSERGRLRRGARRGAQGRIPRHRRSRLRAADRRARSRLGAQQPVPASDRRRIPLEDRRAQYRGAQRARSKACRPTACGSTFAGAITRGRTPTICR